MLEYIHSLAQLVFLLVKELQGVAAVIENSTLLWNSGRLLIRQFHRCAMIVNCIYDESRYETQGFPLKTQTQTYKRTRVVHWCIGVAIIDRRDHKKKE